MGKRVKRDWHIRIGSAERSRWRGVRSCQLASTGTERQLPTPRINKPKQDQQEKERKETNLTAVQKITVHGSQ